MAKIKIDNYTFDASLQKVTFTAYANIDLEAVLLIINTTDNIIIYNFADPTKGGTVASNVLTLAFDTTSMSDGDGLLVYYDDVLKDPDVLVENSYQKQITVSPGHVSTANSTATVLDPGGTNVFTGAWENITNYGVVSIIVKASHDSADGGLCIQMSSDGTVADSEDTYTIYANTGEVYNIPAAAQYFRVVYTNAGTLQTYFRLACIMRSGYVKPSSHRLGGVVTSEDDGEVNKSILAYQSDPDDTFLNVSVQHPLPVDGDAVYSKDLWIDQSSMGGFNGTLMDLFDNLHSIITDATATNPKEIIIHFNRTVVSNVVGLGSFSGDFSNVKLIIINSGGDETTVIDESANATKYTSRTFQLPVTSGFNGLKIQFHTVDPVTLSNCVILKSRGVVSRIQAVKPDGTVVDINATTGSNLKVSIEEFDAGASLPAGTNEIGEVRVTDGVETWSVDVNNYGEISIRGFPANGIAVKPPTGTAFPTELGDGVNTAAIKRADAVPTGATYVQPVQNIDENGDAFVAPADTGAMYQVDMAVSGTEYSQAVPTDCKGFMMQCLQDNDIRYSYEAGKVATPTAPYFLLKAGGVLTKDNLKFSGTIYFATDVAGDDMQIEVWT